MHHLLCSAGRRPANENEGIFWTTTSGVPPEVQHNFWCTTRSAAQLLVYHQKNSSFVLLHYNLCHSRWYTCYDTNAAIPQQVYHLLWTCAAGVPPASQLVSQQYATGGTTCCILWCILAGVPPAAMLHTYFFVNATYGCLCELKLANENKVKYVVFHNIKYNLRHNKS